MCHIRSESLMLQWQILVRNLTSGGLYGYWHEKLMYKTKTPPWYGVPTGPCITTYHKYKSLDGNMWMFGCLQHPAHPCGTHWSNQKLTLSYKLLNTIQLVVYFNSSHDDRYYGLKWHRQHGKRGKHGIRYWSRHLRTGCLFYFVLNMLILFYLLGKSGSWE